ncbi:Spo0E family sporulation regulatory protein-aspartic acid phosphatase [Pontibacillus yanchengensis]|uniref:Spo0E family sporulation regulatory protein-aspartic acid phosphatase n=2 Tax=Pontibacillus yanchengensis TaxID=462910 RepID=A0ACC7VLJ1_9BACI|nr:aspartyl-phosphate phosphatase Spo0E family protein [Pontibacillus yanchengensis]MYL35437.1 Spo0E family sporulation regulatory protein-aspartic acid phosphatase [Pontibacillus yanchengensis]MYL55856.1 Spo0E family sporulation regulatory protein-aspartic acid phosphatase [Pontibacillus yanchengensis]
MFKEVQIKIIIPLSNKDYKKRLGEHVKAKVMECVVSDVSKGSIYFCELTEGSVFYPSLDKGDIVPIETQGDEGLPVIPFSEIQNKDTLIEQIKQSNEHSENQQKRILEFQIKELRTKMYKLAEEYGNSDDKVVQTSQNLDTVLNYYQAIV